MNLDLRLKNTLPAFLTEGPSVRFRAMGKSMYPFIKDGNIVTAAPFKRTVPVPGAGSCHQTKGGRADYCPQGGGGLKKGDS